MSDNLVSQPLPIPTWKMEMGTGPKSTNSPSHTAVSDQQKMPLDQVSYTHGSENMMASNKQLPENQNVGETGSLQDDIGSQKPLLPTKRKASVESLFINSSPQQSSVANKRVAQLEPHVGSPGSSQLSSLSKRHTQGTLNLPNKKMMRNESISNKSGSQRLQTPKSKTAPQEVSPKVQSGSSEEAVRSKMRETLAAALSVGSQNQEKAPNEDKDSPHEAGSVQAQAHEKSTDHGSSVDILKETTDHGSTARETATVEDIRNSDQKGKNGQEPQYNYVMPDADGSFGDTFFVKDELLQGNGLSWAWDMEVADLKEVQTDEKSSLVNRDVGINETEQGQRAEYVDASAKGTERIVKTPEELAFKIETELFKLFGGVNKKYKEKGRSLMFNLKDRNNPELREKVLSGVISPERLCTMTPEELASKELSEWRMAKAEELDKMIVLPDSDVDIRRLVKKTHKGEYQVEVEQDDAVSVEVSVGSNSFTQLRPKKKKTGHHSSEALHEIKEKEVAGGEKNSSQSQDPASSLTIPADGTDFMQELIVDEFKDEGFLPPIVSLDEFMESLDSEPPFQNLPIDAKESKPPTDKSHSETTRGTRSEKVSSEPASAAPVGAKTGSSDPLNKKTTEPLFSEKAHGTSAERKASPAASVLIGKRVWEGELQLTISSSVSVIGLFRSGEKTSTKEWPSSIEIKGRVRLDAFEKFLHELPMSRSRAVMVAHFLLKDASSAADRVSLSEAIDSYVVDQRLGFGEPNPGVELYFCPPHTKMMEMLRRHLSKNQTDILKPTDNGLIGIVVWRKPHISSAISPNSSSHHKHHHRTHNFSTRRHEIINGNTNSNSNAQTERKPPPKPDNDENDDDDDDVPPGFGPGAAARDDDDLPEFSFSGNSKSSGQTIPAQVDLGPRAQSDGSRPSDQMRQLIYRYGQTANGVGVGGVNGNVNGNRGGGVGTRPWNHDDDDDIPEWQPQVPPNHHNRVEVLPVHGVQQPFVGNQIRPPVGPLVPLQPPMQNPSRWEPPLPSGPPPNAAVVGPHYGGQWRQDGPRSRGF